MKILKKILSKFRNKRRKTPNKGVKYIHPNQIPGMSENIDEIIGYLNAAIIIAGKMKKNSCEVETFKMYKALFRDIWADVAIPYNNINQVDADECSDKKYIA